MRDKPGGRRLVAGDPLGAVERRDILRAVALPIRPVAEAQTR